MNAGHDWRLLGPRPAALAVVASLAACLGCSSSATYGNSEAAAAAKSTVAPIGAFGIQIKGSEFVSAKDGSPVQIVSTQVSGLETGHSSRWPAFGSAGVAFWKTLVNYKGSGLNTVRFPLSETPWLNYTCYDLGNGSADKLYAPAPGGGYIADPKKVYQATVKKAVADATAAGLYVIITDTVGAPNNDVGRPMCPIGQPGFLNADHSLAFWKSIADTFKDNPAVIFELFNEPFGNNRYNDWVIHTGLHSYSPGTDTVTLLKGGAYSPFTTQDNTNNDKMVVVNETWQVAGMQDVLNAVRGEGATNVVLSAPVGWAGEIETWLASKPTDPMGQLGVAWHIYGYNKGTAFPLAILAAGFPIAETETFGFDDALDGGASSNGYAWMASHHIGYGWCCWNNWGGKSSLAAAFAEEGPPWYRAPAPPTTN
jgi:endoglucanase